MWNGKNIRSSLICTMKVGTPLDVVVCMMTFLSLLYDVSWQQNWSVSEDTRVWISSNLTTSLSRNDAISHGCVPRSYQRGSRGRARLGRKCRALTRRHNVGGGLAKQWGGLLVSHFPFFDIYAYPVGQWLSHINEVFEFIVFFSGIAFIHLAHSSSFLGSLNIGTFLPILEPSLLT